MTRLTLKQADAIAGGTLAKGKELGLAPLTVVVLDAGGHAVVLKRDDGSSIMRPELATAKAWGALGMGFGGRELARRANKAPGFFAALNSISDGRMAPVPGSALIRDGQGEVIGAVGVSGDTSENDEACLVPAVLAAGLTPDTGDPL
ncbi:heme-binding protein [Candidimonas humi]|uniref:Heme-binding protein n=1 Tax=Candidimonas humi TaxID=683355 RepID=A0ABV8P446_9BURK|nr:heme-binding protein [Candidimonas humi]MBV6307132.1 heme-binding protein [Candidimonas humi]